MTLASHEFIRRFLVHVLPSGFHRIRHYGLPANCVRADNIAYARALLRVSATLDEPVDADAGRAADARLYRRSSTGDDGARADAESPYAIARDAAALAASRGFPWTFHPPRRAPHAARTWLGADCPQPPVLLSP